ncbi:hypothetical protein [Parvibaculum sp. MBR-TMA-1.3b-4.2]|jgi:hypothetical protein
MTKNSNEDRKNEEKRIKQNKNADLIANLIVNSYPNLANYKINLQKIKIPNIKISQETVEQIYHFAESINKIASNISISFYALKKSFQNLQRLERIGWLPHSTTPIFLLNESEEISDTELDKRISKYYTENWDDVIQILLDDLESYLIDEEAKETMREALKAHQAGLFRCTPRLLFPEIERVIRNELHNRNTNKNIASQIDFRKNINESNANSGLGIGFLEITLHRCIQDHVYKKVRTIDEIKEAEKNPTPNRHAVSHGIVIYKTQKSSVNSIIIADYIFRLVDDIKNNKEIDDRV